MSWRRRSLKSRVSSACPTPTCRQDTFGPGSNRSVEKQLVEMLLNAGAEIVVLAGFMRVLKEPMLAAFPRRIVNIHPSLLPKFPGLEAWKQALEANEKLDRSYCSSTWTRRSTMATSSFSGRLRSCRVILRSLYMRASRRSSMRFIRKRWLRSSVTSAASVARASPGRSTHLLVDCFYSRSALGSRPSNSCIARRSGFSL